jgi:uncharacterized protein (DUF1499 family)
MFIAFAERLALSRVQGREENDMAEEQDEPVIEREMGARSPQGQSESPIVPKPPSSFSGKAIFALASASVLIGLVSALGTGWGLWNWQSGFAGVRYAAYLAIATIAIGLLIGWVARKRGGGPKAWRWLGVAIALVFTGWYVSWKYQESSVPAIHDISTDLADPPIFQMIELRADNIDKIPGADDQEMRGLSPQQRWETIHRKGYPDIRTVRIAQPMAEVVGKAERLAKTRGWDIAVALFGFKEDIVLRVRQTEDGTGSVVDMRSVSRVGDSDRGSNARRIREFLADLSGTVSAG